MQRHYQIMLMYSSLSLVHTNVVMQDLTSCPLPRRDMIHRVWEFYAEWRARPLSIAMWQCKTWPFDRCGVVAPCRGV